MTEPREEPAEVVHLDRLGGELLALAREHPAHRSARTVMSGPSMRATVIALTAGAELSEHDSPPAATLHVLSGSVRLHSGDDEWHLDEHEVVVIPPDRHGLQALSDAVVLLTVALR